MNTSKKKTKKISVSRYLPIILVNFIFIFILIQAYLRDKDVHPLFTIMILAIWFVSDLICIFIMEHTRDKIGEKVDRYSVLDSRTNKVLSFIVPKLKYLAMFYVNYLLIIPIIERYLDNRPISNGAYLVLLIYNMFCLWFIMRTNKSKDREFYRFITITLPVIVFLIIDLIVKHK